MDMQTWAKERVCYADGIGYNGQDEMILIESSSGGLNEDLDHTLGDSPKLLENLTAILNTHRGKYLYSDKATFKKLKILGIQSVKTSITLVSVSITDNGTFLYQTHRTTGIPTEMKQSFCLVSLFELLALLLVTQLLDIVDANFSRYILSPFSTGCLSRARSSYYATSKRAYRYYTST